MWCTGGIIRKGSDSVKSALVAVVGLLAVTFTLSGCADKYADVKKSQSEFVKITNEYVADLENVSNAKGAAKAMNSYADDLEKLIPEMKKMTEKYSELDESDDVPSELMEMEKETEAAAFKMAGSFMKLMPYMNDPKVMEAQKRIASVMADE
jgi:predicted nuclease with TOPRIM domain